MMKHIYRFRPHKNILEGYKELKNQSLYFAPLEELNDPVEGFMDYFWKGDEASWTDFFTHYFGSMTISWSLLNRSKYFDEDFRREALINFTWENCNKDLKRIHDQAFEKFIKEPAVTAIISFLSKHNDTIRRVELSYYLNSIHAIGVSLVHETAELLDLIPQPKGETSVNKTKDLFSNKFITIEMLSKLNDDVVAHMMNKNLSREDALVQVNLGFRISSAHLQNFKDTDPDVKFFNHDFPNSYMDNLDGRLSPNRYVTCFSESYKNSSMWGQYAESHKGVCFEYYVGSSENMRLKIHHPENESNVLHHPICKVKYDGYGEIDYFKCIKDLNTGAANQTVLKIFQLKVLNKTPDWDFEEERRIVLFDDNKTDYSNKDNRLLKYHIDSLSGVIFGIKMPESDKTAIIDHFASLGDSSKGVEFYQAYYSHANKRIERYKLKII